jgi:hypothetical protein
MLIGFSGMRTAGKTTAARILIEEFGFSQAKFAFAVKEAARIGFGLNEEQLNGSLKEVSTDRLGGKTPRDAMEWIGEGGRRMFGEDVWVKRWFELNAELLDGTNWVFDDVRNHIEADAIKRHGGTVVRIFNPKADAQKILPSEEGLSYIRPDLVLANNLNPRFADDVRALAHDIGLKVSYGVSEAAFAS